MAINPAHRELLEFVGEDLDEAQARRFGEPIADASGLQGDHISLSEEW